MNAVLLMAMSCLPGQIPQTLTAPPSVIVYTTSFQHAGTCGQDGCGTGTCPCGASCRCQARAATAEWPANPTRWYRTCCGCWPADCGTTCAGCGCGCGGGQGIANVPVGFVKPGPVGSAAEGRVSQQIVIDPPTR